MKTFPRNTSCNLNARLLLAAALLLLTNLCIAAPAPEMKVHIIDVGQGNSALLEFPCGAVLIDAGLQEGGDPQVLIAYLTKVFAARPDLHNTLESIFLTHPHKDHTAALQPVIEHFNVKRFIEDGLDSGSGRYQVKWVRDHAHTDGHSIKVVKISDSQVQPSTGLTDADIDPLSCAACDPKILILAGGKTAKPAGWSATAFGNENNHSLVIRVEFGHASFLFTGDLEKEGVATLLARYPPHSPLLDADVYHVGHHGSNNGTTQPLLDAVTPHLAIISVGDWHFGFGSSSPYNTYAYGHPRASTITLLSTAIPETRTPVIFAHVASAGRVFATKRVKQNIYATAWDGNIIITAHLDGSLAVSRKN